MYLVLMTTRERLNVYEKKFGRKYKIPSFGDSIFQERLLRFGQEYKDLGLESPYDKTTTNVVVESIMLDVIRHIEGTLRSPLSDSIKERWCIGYLS